MDVFRYKVKDPLEIDCNTSFSLSNVHHSIYDASGLEYLPYPTRTRELPKRSLRTKRIFIARHNTLPELNINTDSANDKVPVISILSCKCSRSSKRNISVKLTPSRDNQRPHILCSF